jgi:hypothetical protein
MHDAFKLKKSEFIVKSLRSASSIGVPNACKQGACISGLVKAGQAPLQHDSNKAHTIVGMRLASAYVSERRLTKSTSCPITFTSAVSRCLDCSGFAATVAMREATWPRRFKYVFTNSANTTPVHVSSAISISLDSRPSICKHTKFADRRDGADTASWGHLERVKTHITQHGPGP